MIAFQSNLSTIAIIATTTAMEVMESTTISTTATMIPTPDITTPIIATPEIIASTVTTSDITTQSTFSITTSETETTVCKFSMECIYFSGIVGHIFKVRNKLLKM